MSIKGIYNFRRGDVFNLDKCFLKVARSRADELLLANCFRCDMLMRISSYLYIKWRLRAGPFHVIPGRDKSYLGRANQLSLCNQALAVSYIVTQIARESFGICGFRGSCMRDYDLI